MKIDYVVISSDDNPMYKDFYPIVAKRWSDMGYKTYYVNITDNNSILENEFGIIHNVKAIPNIPTGFQSQVVRLFTSNFIDANLLMSDIDMLPINKDYYEHCVSELTPDNIIIYSGQPYGDVPYYPMCYILGNSKTLSSLLDISNITFEDYCFMLKDDYNIAWNTDEQFMYDKLSQYPDKLVIKNNRDFSRRINRTNWNYNLELLEKGYYIDSHMLRPYKDYKTQIDKLINKLYNYENT